MRLKRAIIEEMKARQMRKAVRKLGIPVTSYREKESLAHGLGKSSRATVDALIVYLSEKDVKRLCERRGIDAKGRRRELVARLMESAKKPGGGDERGGQETDKRARKRGRRRAAVTPDLQFGTSTDRTGFTPAGIAAFSDLRPAAVVRELIQNSLDAALIEAGEATAHVRFERTTCTLDDVPGIDSYRTAFERALDEQSPSGSARAVVERIDRTLRKESHDLLYVTDNGIGLDGKRMSALLSDGVSAKSGHASGTFGNGHSVVIPASNLRYVLYGGLTEDGQSYGAGQAVLASHRVEGELFGCSGRGVYLESFKPSSSDVPFTLAQNDAVPSMIAVAIERMREEHGHGAAVIIPAFNNFEHEQLLREAVFRAAAFNFFQAIHEGLLVVSVEDPAGGGELDRSTLRDALSPYRDEIRSRRSGAFLSGRKANEAFETLVDGEYYVIETSQGDVPIRLLRRKTGRRTVGLCRNGMWITDELPMFQNAFGDRQPFQALILLSSGQESVFFELIQEAETPLHDKLALKQMERSRRNALRQALRELRDQVAELVPVSTEDVYSPEDILSFQFDDVEGQGRGGRQPSYWGRVGSTRRPMAAKAKGAKSETGGAGLGGGDGGRRKPKGRIVVEPIFRIASVPTGGGGRRVHIECSQDFDDAELRMFVDENVDATCDRQTRAQSAAVLLSHVKVNGSILDDEHLVRNGDGAIGARLGSLSADSTVIFEAECSVQSDLIRLPPGQDPALRIEVLSSREVASPDPESSDG